MPTQAAAWPFHAGACEAAEVLYRAPEACHWTLEGPYVTHGDGGDIVQPPSHRDLWKITEPG